ncbi:MAG TPA: arylsulfotransferase family protein [Solirubrobacteraceae bacterium]|nr:arylsulfotransferase family protein [Solirubrobacteraceae bacterium]
MRRRVTAVAVAAAGAGAALVAALGQAQVAPERVTAFPMPGSPVARAETQITLRGVPPERLGAIEVSGSRSGAHPGVLRSHADGQGASFMPERRFEQGETVTVRTGLDIPGARDGDFTFTVARRPSFASGGDGTLKLPPLPPAAIDRFRTRRDLEAPVVRTTRRTRGTQPGLIFLAPFSPKGSPRPDGPLITDDRGDLVWFKPVRRGTAVTDLKVQRLGGEPVITWWEGRFAVGWGYGAYKVFDAGYRQIATIRPGNGLTSDLHDMQLTDRGTALLLSYDRVKRDLRFIGGARHGRLLDNVVQEVDLATGLVLFEWHSVGQVPVQSSRTRPDGPRSWDYFHINAVEEDDDGDLIISARNMCALYKLDRETGQIVWQLGGEGGDFRMGRGTPFCFQHDARRAGPGRISLFDNSAGPPVLRKRSRGLVLAVDETAKRVRLVHQYEHPGGISAPNQGSTRVQPNGNVFVGWGAAPVFSEFTAGGRLLLDGRLTRGKGNYRAIRERWTGRPLTRPAVAAERTRRGRVLVWASWNGATEVARWQVLAGTASRLRGVASKARDGFETEIAARTGASHVVVRALAADGTVLGESRAVRPRR